MSKTKYQIRAEIVERLDELLDNPDVNPLSKILVNQFKDILTDDECEYCFPLPKDANDEYIMVGDYIHDKRRNMTRRVQEIAYRDDGKWFIHYHTKTGDGLHSSILPQDTSYLVHADKITGAVED